jgi:hypothetical protein
MYARRGLKFDLGFYFLQTSAGFRAELKQCSLFCILSLLSVTVATLATSAWLAGASDVFYLISSAVFRCGLWSSAEPRE